MKILYVNPICYDFLAATIIEGLRELSATHRVELITSARSNYASRRQTWSRSKIVERRREFDLFILGTGEGVDPGFFWDVAKPQAAVCLDGQDSADLAWDPADFAMYFKRESPTPERADVRPCPFAVERRWWQRMNPRPTYSFSAVFAPRPGIRALTLQELETWNFPNAFLGPVPPTWRSVAMGLLKGQCMPRVWRMHRFAVGHNRPYYRVLNQSRASLTVPGDGVDTGRFWEILGAGALLVSPRLPIQIPFPLVSGEHFLEYGSSEELKAALRRVVTDAPFADRLRRAAREHALRFHTSKRRATYLLHEIDPEKFRL